jgi:hypothetical protein
MGGLGGDFKFRKIVKADGTANPYCSRIRVLADVKKEAGESPIFLLL